MKSLLANILERSETLPKVVLNTIFAYAIPFNKPHSFRITELTGENSQVFIPYRRRNFNHVRGVHACALATGAEFASGLLLVKRLDAKKYRLLMKQLQVVYEKQARSDVIAHFSLSQEALHSKILQPLESQEAVEFEANVEVKTQEGEVVCRAAILWHIKSWDTVTTPVSK